MFIHSARVSSGTIMFDYLNVYMISNGFIYILSGLMLLKLVIEYIEADYLIWSALLIAIIPWIGSTIYHGRTTIPLAISIACMIYLIVNKHYKWFIATLLWSLIPVVLCWKWIMFKWFFRPIVWSELRTMILNHPIIGNGFPHYVRDNNMIYSHIRKAFEYRSSDYMAFASDMGIVAPILLLCFLLTSYYKIKNRVGSILLLTIMIAPFFQCITYSPYRGTIMIVAIGLLIKESYARASSTYRT